jgi:hypothetical protein
VSQAPVTPWSIWHVATPCYGFVGARFNPPCATVTLHDRPRPLQRAAKPTEQLNPDATLKPPHGLGLLETTFRGLLEASSNAAHCGLRVTFRVSFLEVVGTEARDLLSLKPASSTVIIRDNDPEKDMAIGGCEEVLVTSEADLLEALSLGHNKRAELFSSDAPPKSWKTHLPRSHALFIVHVEQHGPSAAPDSNPPAADVPDLLCRSTICFVDLAFSAPLRHRSSNGRALRGGSTNMPNPLAGGAGESGELGWQVGRSFEPGLSQDVSASVQQSSGTLSSDIENVSVVHTEPGLAAVARVVDAIQEGKELVPYRCDVPPC